MGRSLISLRLILVDRRCTRCNRIVLQTLKIRLGIPPPAVFLNSSRNKQTQIRCRAVEKALTIVDTKS